MPQKILQVLLLLVLATSRTWNLALACNTIPVIVQQTLLLVVLVVVVLVVVLAVSTNLILN